MELVSASPLRVASVLWQKGTASWVLTVVCKATFDLAPGECPLAADQEAPNEVDVHWNDDVSRSLHAPSDLSPLKLRADVVLVGSAYPPGGVPTRSLTTRLFVNQVDKAVECVADRAVNGREVQEGAGFTRMPLVYERAAGGPGTVNPVGMRRDGRDTYGRILLPNLQAPGSRLDAVEPIGFGPLAPRWPQRLEKLGRHAASWSPAEWNNRPLPGDIDLAHFNVAPLDQQVSALRDNERIVLENLHREHPRLVTALPGIRPCAFVEGRAGAPFRLPMHADTLWIDTDRARCTVVWRCQLPLERPDEQGRVVVAMEQPGQTLSWADVEPMLPIEIEPDEDQGAAPPQTQTLAFTGAVLHREGGGLPFVSTGRPPPGVTWGGAPKPPPAAPPPKGAPARAPERGADVSRVAAPPPPPPMAVPAPLPVRPSVSAPIDSPWTSGAVASLAKGPTVTALPVEPRQGARPEPLPPPPRAEATEIFELLWFDGDSVPRIRRHAAWKPILAALEQQPVDRDLDDPALADAPMEMEDRREVFEILAHGSPGDEVAVERALEAAVRTDGKFVPQLALLAGQLAFAFDELETLKATVATVAPFVTAVTAGQVGGAAQSSGDEALKGAVDAAKAFLQTADELTPPSVAEGMTARIRAAFCQGKRGVPDTHLEEQTDRVLLGQRRYQKRIVFGASHLRCLVHVDGSAVPGYLPESLAKKLPMYQRFKGRLIVEVHQQADQYESHYAALRVVALARATPRRVRG